VALSVGRVLRGGTDYRHNLLSIGSIEAKTHKKPDDLCFLSREHPTLVEREERYTSAADNSTFADESMRDTAARRVGEPYFRLIRPTAKIGAKNGYQATFLQILED